MPRLDWEWDDVVSTDFVARVLRAWERFTQTGAVDTSVVRPEVAASWQRCATLQLDPRAPKAPVKLNARQLAALKDANRALLEVALPFMAFLRNAVRSTGFTLVLTDRDGVVLELFGVDDILALARGNNYVPGCSRAEAVVGTNAICLALSEGKPVQLTGAEHFNVRHHQWTCAAAPVFGADRALLGSVTLSGETLHSHRHTLGMVISAAEAIHERLCEREAHQHRSRLDVMLSSILTTISDALITVDATGLVTNVNPTAARMLAIRPEQACGKSVLRLFPGNPELVGVLEGGKDAGTIEVAGTNGRGHFVVTPFVMHDQGSAQGAVLAIRERKEFLNDVREISGLDAVFRFDDLVGRSPALRRQIDLARITARQNSRILITGETGTGKELFAQAIHNASPRSAGPFVALNCAAIPRELIESELFGYKGGAFTGSRKGGQVGKLELADGGTLFLDELGQMPLDLQSKLLRALQDGNITRLGDSRPIRVDVRIVAATNEDLYEKSRNGGFRQDLYYRLSVVEITLPPLRERVEDIPLLAEHIVAKLAAKVGKGRLKLSKAALALLCRHPWSGNVRELENVLEMATIVCEGGSIEPAHLTYRMKRTDSDATLRASRPTADAGAGTQPLSDVEIEAIRRAMQDCAGNVALVARKLHVSRSTLYRRMKEHGITRSFQVT